jgi:undecaprenyl-diphosphatase
MYKKRQKAIFARLWFKNLIDIYNEFELEFVILFILLFVVSFLIFFLARYVIVKSENFIDYNIFLLVKKIINPTGIKIAKLITLFGTGNFLVPAYIFIIIYLARQNYGRLAFLTSTAAVSSLLLGWMLKWMFHRQRPLDHLVNGAGGYSFPSGHALGGFIFTGVILYLVWKIDLKYRSKCILSVFAFFLGLCVGLSRIYLHVHYATDVLGSLFISIWWLSFIHIVFRVLFGNNFYNIQGRHQQEYYPRDYYLNN